MSFRTFTSSSSSRALLHQSHHLSKSPRLTTPLSTLTQSLSISTNSVRTFSSSPRRNKHFIDATKEDFEKEVMERMGEKTDSVAAGAVNSRAVVVDFFADWCPPCKVLSPILEKTITEESGVDLMTINTEKAPELAAKYKVSSIPTVLAFNPSSPSHPTPVEGFVGALPEPKVREFLERVKGAGDGK